jgi:hypothetical protein
MRTWLRPAIRGDDKDCLAARRDGFGNRFDLKWPIL